jgi:hypothetical protein
LPRLEARPLGEGGHLRVFILGAGAAVHAEYPLGKDLLCEISKMVQEKNPSTDRDYVIKHDCLTQLEKQGIDLVHGDCEEIVSNLEQPDGNKYLVDVLKACVSELFDERQRKDKAETYKKFAAQVAKQGDLIITFNYDTSLELELKKAGKWRIRDGYGFPPDNIEPRMVTHHRKSKY